MLCTNTLWETLKFGMITRITNREKAVITV